LRSPLLILLALAACDVRSKPATTTPTAGDTDTDTDTDSATDTGTRTGLSFAVSVQPILDDNCAPCHIGGGSSGGFEADTYADVVGPTNSLSGLAYVEPGDPSQSYLWAKLTNTQSSVGGGGSQMPTTGALPQGELDTIEQWIVDGALP